MGGDSFRCMDMATGEVIWEHRVEAAGYNASAALHDGRVFVSTALRAGGLLERRASTAWTPPPARRSGHTPEAG